MARLCSRACSWRKTRAAQNIPVEAYEMFAAAPVWSSGPVHVGQRWTLRAKSGSVREPVERCTRSAGAKSSRRRVEARTSAWHPPGRSGRWLHPDPGSCRQVRRHRHRFAGRPAPPIEQVGDRAVHLQVVVHLILGVQVGAGEMVDGAVRVPRTRQCRHRGRNRRSVRRGRTAHQGALAGVVARGRIGDLEGALVIHRSGGGKVAQVPSQRSHRTLPRMPVSPEMLCGPCVPARSNTVPLATSSYCAMYV